MSKTGSNVQQLGSIRLEGVTTPFLIWFEELFFIYFSYFYYIFILLLLHLMHNVSARREDDRYMQII